MTCDLEPATPGVVYRLGRRPDPWAYPDWSHAGEDSTFGNRWDDPEGSYRVVYSSSQRMGAFLETLARFRPDPHVSAGLAEIEGDEDDSVPPGTVPGSWLNGRLIGTAVLTGSFADVGRGRSIAFLRRQLAGRVLHYGLPDLDAAAIRLSAPRRFTQEISRFVYACTTGGERQFEGIRYLSRLGDEVENWAMFEPGVPQRSESTPISRSDPDLLEALERLGLTLVD